MTNSSHGTLPGYRQHRVDGTAACRLCRSAWSGYTTHLRMYGPKPKHGLAELLVDVVATHQPVAMTELSALLPNEKPESLRRVAYRLVDRGLLSRSSGGLTV